MTGTAYRIAARPHSESEYDMFSPADAVYEVYPPLLYSDGVTSYVIASSSLRDTGLYLCTETGLILRWSLIACEPGTCHGRVLRAAGYELGVVVSGRA